MSYGWADYGRDDRDASVAGRIADDDAFWSFDRVQERLIEAWGFLHRLPDRERQWMREPGAATIYARGQLSRHELWSLYRIDSDDYDRDQRPKLPGLRSVEVDRMWEALGWIEWVTGRDRKLVGIAIGQMARGAARPSWVGAARSLGWGGHPDTLAKRYATAINRIAINLTRRKAAENCT